MQGLKNMTKVEINTSTLISIGAIILSISAIGMSFQANSIPTDVTERLDEQQQVIMNSWGLIQNNTAQAENQFLFNQDVISWAGNVTAKIDALATFHP